MATAPYWGQLPPPKIARGNSLRREQEQENLRDSTHLSIDSGARGNRLSSQSQSRRRSDRNSTQTEAPTVSTQSPFASPTDSTFPGGGLAPRPPSFPYGASGPSYNEEYLEKRRRRQSRDRDQAYQEPEAAEPPPAAPDAPRPPPPVSYKQPHGLGASSSSYQPPAHSRSTRRSEGPVSSSQGVADEYYRSNPRREYPAAEALNSKRGSIDKGKAPVRPNDKEWDSEMPEKLDVSRRQRRQGSGSEAPSQRRREWAPDRSPLQRLELTLDSITKEEKRARVEEAELLAREAKRGRGGEKAKQNSVRFRNRPVAKGETSTEPDPQTSADRGLSRNLSGKLRKPQPRSETTEPSTSAAPPTERPTNVFDYQMQPEHPGDVQKEVKSGVPRRGQSVRDRSYIPVAVGTAAAGGAAKLGRSASNKLKKEPPGDPWLHLRVEAENLSQTVPPRRQSVPNQQTRGPSDDAALRSQPQSSRDKELPVLPPESQQTSNRSVNKPDSPSSEDVDVKPVRRGTLTKLQRLTGENIVPQSSRSIQPRKEQATEVVKVNGTKYQIPPTVSDDITRNSPHHEPLGPIGNPPDALGSKQQSHPGEGVYVPSRRLDEWKKGGIAQLSGSLLDLADDEQVELEKDKTWWEAGNTGKRRRSTANQRKAEAYDGEYDETNGTVTQISLSCVNCERGISHLRSPGRTRNALNREHPSYYQHPSYGGQRVKRLEERAARTRTMTPQSHPRTNPQTYSQICFICYLLNLVQIFLSPIRYIISRRSCANVLVRPRPNIAPTRFKPRLFLRTGPILRYCGLRREAATARPGRATAGTAEREIWKGSIMIVTHDDHSSYELAPTLRLFLQPMVLLPPPPAQVGGEELAPEYVDPIAGLPKIGRDGRTLYVRPVEDLEEERDLSREESDGGLFELQRSSPEDVMERKFAKPHYDGEKAGKYKEVRGFRLHAEQGVTFWRFNIEIELRDKQQRIAYRINRGPATGFWVPARGQPMNIMFHSCNGFGYDVNTDPFNGPDPMWRDVLNNHQTQPFHVMLGGGDQIYNDALVEESTYFKEWTLIKDSHLKQTAPFTLELQEELESFYLTRYCTWFSQGLFGLATSQIPMINVFDDHDILDGYGSYPDHYMRSAVMSGLGAIAFKYYMLFQHQSSIDEGEETEPHWILGEAPGPYIGELSRSIFTQLGRSVAFLGLDCRTERMSDEIVSAETYHKVLDRLERDVIKGETKHLIVMLGIPVAYPRMVWLENIMSSRAMMPIKALGRTGLLGKNLLNHFDGGIQLLDDLDDHWTAKHHKEERNWLIQELQDLAAEKSVRVTILGGDVHLGAIGQFYSNAKHGIPKDKDHRYMPNVISSAIVNAPPPDAVADLFNKRNKVHHMDADTDEDMIPIFTHDVNGKPRNNKCLLNRRNWCSIRAYDPELSPPPTPQRERSPSPPPASRGGLFRRLSTSRGPSYRPDVSAPHPPLSSASFFGRRLSTSRRGSTDSERPNVLTRTLSLNRKDFTPKNIFRRNSRTRKPDSGGINGYGEDSTDDDSLYRDDQPQRVGMRGGSGGHSHDDTDYDEEDESYFPHQPRNRAQAPPAPTSVAGSIPQRPISKFHRTPTGLSQKQRKTIGEHHVNLEGGLDICLNVEVNHKDPAGITTPYRLLVPALWYREEAHQVYEEKPKGKTGMGLGRWPSLRR
ncbi:Metallo-dependent phosphatase [Venustampulla echinocandica]|uniref:Metallo-dependent phosphatase n=1 Tax=Venustampulla echinocandica TaxID=2656787 RepID=A0A370TE48_9HELO|nr:Metallo-dependent phosphatase [Venustampulla echinocandica]RDL32965.1 Metallo-dependent phosphatase [Venustampulla echinocandica]